MKKMFLLSLFATAAVAALSGFKLPAPAGYKIGDKAEDFRLKNITTIKVKV